MYEFILMYLWPNDVKVSFPTIRQRFESHHWRLLEMALLEVLYTPLLGSVGKWNDNLIQCFWVKLSWRKTLIASMDALPKSEYSSWTRGYFWVILNLLIPLEYALSVRNCNTVVLNIICKNTNVSELAIQQFTHATIMMCSKHIAHN